LIKIQIIPETNHYCFLSQGLILPKISGKFTYNFINNPTDRQTNQQTKRGKNITYVADVIIIIISASVKLKINGPQMRYIVALALVALKVFSFRTNKA